MTTEQGIAAGGLGTSDERSGSPFGRAKERSPLLPGEAVLVSTGKNQEMARR